MVRSVREVKEERMEGFKVAGWQLRELVETVKHDVDMIC